MKMMMIKKRAENAKCWMMHKRIAVSHKSVKRWCGFWIVANEHQKIAHTRMQKFAISYSIFSSFYFFFHFECCHNFSSSVLLSLSLFAGFFSFANVWTRIKFYSVDTWFICNDEYSAIRDALSLPVLSPFIYMLQQALEMAKKNLKRQSFCAMHFVWWHDMHAQFFG